MAVTIARTTAEGAKTLVFAATAPAASPNGYYSPSCQIRPPSATTLTAASDAYQHRSWSEVMDEIAKIDGGLAAQWRK